MVSAKTTTKKKQKTSQIDCFGVGKYGNETVLFYLDEKDQSFKIAVFDYFGKNFKKPEKSSKLNGWNLPRPKNAFMQDFRLSLVDTHYYLTYLEEENNHYQLKYRWSKNFLSWSPPQTVDSVYESGMVIPDDKKKEKFLVFGRKELTVAHFKKLRKRIYPISKYSVQERVLGRDNLKIGQIFNLDQGILVLCYRYQDLTLWDTYSWQLILLDKHDLSKIVWSKNLKILGTIPNKGKKPIRPLGVVKLNGKLISYWQINHSEVISLTQPFFVFDEKKSYRPPRPYLNRLSRLPYNPILKPRPENSWESKQVFNPTAVEIDNEVHLLYRAVGRDDVSSFGYALSENGETIDRRLNYPAYQLRRDFETNRKAPVITYQNYASGYGIGGCEDPKLTRLGDRIYMTYTAWNGTNPPGVALTWIKVQDFVNQKWNWSQPKLISPPNEIHKNWVIFPEKINGKYAVLHSISPDILIEYLDDLRFEDDACIRSYYRPSGRKNYWDTWIRGAGPPPIKTSDGWLLLYHAMDENDPGRYKVGAMMLDENDPTRILYRANNPLLEPDMYYENQGWKAGVVYACGAVVKDEQLLVYYGGADTVSCVAKTELSVLLDQMKRQEEIEMNRSSLLN